MTLYCEDFESQECDNPDCHENHTTSELYINPRCHPGGGVEVYYWKSELYLHCNVCNMPVVRVAVARNIPEKA